MDEILAHITSPTWWFDGLFFTSFLFLFGKMAKYAAHFFRKSFRFLTARRLRKIKKIRCNYLAVNYEIGKVNAYFVLFLLICCFYLFLFVSSSGSLALIMKSNFFIIILLTLPVYVFEVVWLIQDIFTKDLIERSHRMRIITSLQRKRPRRD